MKRNVNDPKNLSDRAVGGRRAYERPSIQAFTGDEILEILGPAQGYSGDPVGTSSGGSF